MTNQNRFLLPHTSASNASSSSSPTPASHSSSGSATQRPDSSSTNLTSQLEQENNQLSVDTDFDSYWEEEARNPHRNRIRIGRQYQATVPPLLKAGDKDARKLEDLETLSFCPMRSAKVSNAELDHYFTVAKSLNLFASLVETRSLLGRDVTIADLNHIRRKEGLSLASVIHPPARSHVSPQSSQNQPLQQQAQQTNPVSSSQMSPQKSPQASNESRPSTTSSSPRETLASYENYAFNQPLMKALSHFISLHHPCHHNSDCKKLLKDIPLEEDEAPVVSITAGNLRQGTSSSSSSKDKPGRSRSSLKQNQSTPSAQNKPEEADNLPKEGYQDNLVSGDNVQSPSYEDWTREEVELFSKAIEVCGKNFGSIKKEFLPSKSVRSIVEYYYIGSRDVAESKKKSYQNVEANDGCSSPEKSTSNNNSQGGGGGNGSGGTSGKSGPNPSIANPSNPSSSRTNNPNADSNKSLSNSSSGVKQTSASSSSSSSSSSQQQLQDLSEKTLQIPGPIKIEDLSNCNKIKPKNIDARMSVYNFDDEFKEDSPIRFDCPRPGAEVKPLKAKPIIPNASLDSEAGNSNVGSLKFFMDGQLVLKLNACQEQQEGIEKCHWVQSGDKVTPPGKQKKYTKRAGGAAGDRPTDSSNNGSQSNSVVSSNHDDDSKNEDLTNDEDSKESANSFTNVTSRQKSFSASPTPKRLRTKNDSCSAPKQAAQLNSPTDYNRIAVNNRMKERNDNNPPIPSPMMNQAAMPWFQANSLAVAAALLGRLPFPTATSNMINSHQMQNTAVNMATSKPMDLSLEHNAPKPIQAKASSRSRSRSKNNN